MMGRFKVGDIGEGGDENTQLIKLGNIIKEYHTNTWDKVAGYVGEGMSRLYDEKVLPYTFIQRRLANIAVFKNDRVGTSRAIERALNQLEQNGDIEQIPKHVAQSKYGTSAKCFIVKHPAAFGFGKK